MSSEAVRIQSLRMHYRIRCCLDCNFAPLNNNFIIEIAENVGFTIVDRMLGGQGRRLTRRGSFSEIELLLIERIYNVCVNLLVEPWASVCELTPRLERIETNSQYAQIISPTEMIALITLNIKIGDVEGLINSACRISHWNV